MTQLSDDLFMGIHDPAEFKDILDDLPTQQDIFMPLINYDWPLWNLFLESTSQSNSTFHISIFQNELTAYLKLIKDSQKNNNLFFNIIIHQKLNVIDLQLFQNLSTNNQVYFSLLVDRQWPAEETIKSLPFYVRVRLSFSFDHGPLDKQYLGKEKSNLINRLFKYFPDIQLKTAILPGVGIQTMDSKIQPKPSYLLPNPAEVFSILTSHLKAIRYFLGHNFILFLIGTFYSTYNLFLTTLYPLIHFIIVVIPIRIQGRLLYFRGLIEWLLGQLHRAWGGVMWCLGMLDWLRGQLIHYWWEYSFPLRKIYYVLKFHYKNRNELPKKFALVLKGKKSLW